MNNKSLPPDQLLGRIAKSLKTEIGPAVNAAYPKTQAFLTAVVLEKLAGQLKFEQEHTRIEDRELLILSRDLIKIGEEDLPATLKNAIVQVNDELDIGSVSALIKILYDNKPVLNEKIFDMLLGRIRKFLRSRVDRAMEYSA
ncbi:hypothetical protein MK292_05080 [Myxococcota bacterium]|nr:hypothetical protein [Myxococcota bacterium]